MSTMNFTCNEVARELHAEDTLPTVTTAVAKVAQECYQPEQQGPTQQPTYDVQPHCGENELRQNEGIPHQPIPYYWLPHVTGPFINMD